MSETMGFLGSTSPADSAAGWLRRLPLVLLLIAAAGFLGLGLVEAHSDSPTFDEPVYVAAGVTAVLHHNLAFNAEHPPLPKAVAALPVLLVHPAIPDGGHWTSNDERGLSATFVHAQVVAGSLRRVTFASRLVPLAESIGVAFAAYGLGLELFGAAAGAWAGLLWLASPLVLAIGHLDGTDIPFALAVTLSSWALARWLRLRTIRALVWTGLALALVAGTQISGALVVLVSLAVIVAVSWRSGPRQALGYAALAGVVTWAGLWLPYIVLDPSVLTHLTVIAPKPYLDGLTYLSHYDASASRGYLAGVAYTGTRWWFWPLSLVVKYPAELLILLVGGTVALIWTDSGARRRAILAVGLPAIALAGFTVTTPLDIGVRLLLPAIALWTVLAGALAPVVLGLRRTWRTGLATAMALLLAATAASTVLSFPESLAWTAPPFTPGYAVTTDSNVDWGQGFYALQAWSEGRDPWVTYFGPRGLTSADIPGARPLLGADPSRVTGWVAVSATALTSAYSAQLGWLRNYCPVRVLAGSILLYHFAEPPVVAPAPDRPPTVCAGQWSSFRNAK